MSLKMLLSKGFRIKPPMANSFSHGISHIKPSRPVFSHRYVPRYARVAVEQQVFSHRIRHRYLATHIPPFKRGGGG